MTNRIDMGHIFGIRWGGVSGALVPISAENPSAFLPCGPTATFDGGQMPLPKPISEPDTGFTGVVNWVLMGVGGVN